MTLNIYKKFAVCVVSFSFNYPSFPIERYVTIGGNVRIWMGYQLTSNWGEMKSPCLIYLTKTYTSFYEFMIKLQVPIITPAQKLNDTSTS